MAFILIIARPSRQMGHYWCNAITNATLPSKLKPLSTSLIFLFILHY